MKEQDKTPLRKSLRLATTKIGELIEENYRLKESAEWSEEDEKCIKDIIICLEHLKREDTERQWNGDRNVNPKRYDGMIAKLNSLHPHPHWKPTEKMLEALKWAKCEFHPDCSETMEQLEYLYTELKKIYYDGD